VVGLQSVVRPVQKFGPVSRWVSVIALAVAVTAVGVIVRDSRSSNAPPPVTVRTPSARPFRLAASRSIPAPGAAAIIKHGNTLLVVSLAREGGLIRLVEHHATLRPAKHSLPHAVIHAHAGLTITLVTRGSSYYIRSGTRTWRLTGHHVQSVAATKLSPAVARQLAGTVGMGRVWIAAHQKLFAVSPAGHRHLVSVGPSRLPKNGLAPVIRAPVVAAGSVWVTQSATSEAGADLAYLQRVHPTGGGADGAPIALGHGIPVLALAAGGRIWVVTNTERRHSLIWQIDPSTGRALGSTQLPASFLPTVGRGTNSTLWLASNGPRDGRLFRFAMR
jgi:hypothetical protein